MADGKGPQREIRLRGGRAVENVQRWNRIVDARGADDGAPWL